MHPKVEAYIQEREAQRKATYETEKQQFLMAANICDLEFSPDGAYSSDYPDYELNPETNIYSHCRKRPIELSDEEYEALRSAHERAEKSPANEPSNSVATVISAIAWIVYIGSIILGLVLGMREVTYGTYYTYTKTVFSFSTALIYWVAGFISGTTFLGFSEIIKLLQKIGNKLN